MEKIKVDSGGGSVGSNAAAADFGFVGEGGGVGYRYFMYGTPSSYV